MPLPQPRPQRVLEPEDVSDHRAGRAPQLQLPVQQLRVEAPRIGQLALLLLQLALDLGLLLLAFDAAVGRVSAVLERAPLLKDGDSYVWLEA